MKVIHLVMSKSFGGLELHVDELFEAQKTSITPILICNKEIAHRFSSNKQIHAIDNFNRFSFTNIYRLAKKIHKINPDIIHTHGSKTTTIINIIKWFLPYKHIATIHGNKSNLSPYERADHVIGVNKHFLTSIKAPHTAIGNWWKPSLPKTFTKKPQYALAVGRLEKVKGFDILIKAWQGINHKLVIIGCGQEKQSLLSLIQEHQLEDKIRILPSMSSESLIKHFQEASVFILSSLREGTPRVVLEALYLQTPVLSTHVGAVPELLPKKYIAPTENIKALHQLIKKHITQPESLEQTDAFERVQEHYSLKKKCQETLEVYQSVIQEPV